jgi:hypothetical protein
VSEVLQREGVSVTTDHDVVIFNVGKHGARFSYHSAFLIAQRLRLASSVAGRAAGISREEIGEMKRQPIDAPQFNEVVLDDGLGVHSGFAWRVWYEGELVVFQISDLIIRWEAPSALQIATWFRQAGTKAKAAAGDRSRTLNIAGTLTDANANANLNG